MLKHKKFIIVMAIMIVVASLLSLFQIKKLEDPILNLPFYNISFIAPGATSNTLEKDILEDLKDEISNLEDIVETSYNINDNFFTVKVEAESDVDVDDKLNELKRIVNNLNLPDYVKKTTVKKINPLDVNVVQLALYKKSKYFDYKLNVLANRLKDKLENIKGVNKVFISGEREQVLDIALDIKKLQTIKLPIDLVIKKIEDRFNIFPSGKLVNDVYSLPVKVSYGFENFEDLKELVLLNRNGNTLYLKDIAKISITEKSNNKHYTKYNENPCVFVSATVKKDANLFHISKETDKITQDFVAKNNIIIDKVFDQSKSVKLKLSDLTWNIIQGILLIFVLIFFILGVRNAAIAGIIIPISIISAISLLYMLGFALQQISIAALIISIGLVIDDNIVIIENIHRLLSEGKSKKEAITVGVKSIMWPVINSSVTTALVFFPMMNLGGRTGQYIKTLPITVCLCLSTSLVFSIILTPIFCQFFLKTETETNLLTKKLDALSNKYVKFLDYILKKPAQVGITLIVILAASVAVFKIVGVTLFPPADKPILLIDIESLEGKSFKDTEKVVDNVYSLIKKDIKNANYSINIGKGNPKLYYNIFPKNYKENYGQIILFFDEWVSNEFDEVKKSIQEKFKHYNKARVSVSELVNGPPITAPIEIKILGSDDDNLKKQAQKVIGLLKEDNAIKNISSPFDFKKFIYSLDVDMLQASKFEISNTEINRNLFMLLSGYETQDIDVNGEEYPIQISLNTNSKPDNFYTDLTSNLSVQSRVSKNYIPYENFSSISLKKEINNIEYYNNKKAITITCEVEDGINVLEKTEQLIEKINSLKLNNVDIEYAGEYKTSKKSFGGVVIILIIALFAIYGVLVLQFKSYLQPFIVLLAIPLAFIGAIFLLFMFNKSFSFLAFIGFTSISGIVINNSMLLVDTFNTLRSDTLKIKEAVILSSKQRFLPILITSATTVFGLLPMIISGSNLWQPLALTIVGGMISSTILVLIIIPILLSRKKKNQ